MSSANVAKTQLTISRESSSQANIYPVRTWIGLAFTNYDVYDIAATHVPTGPIFCAIGVEGMNPDGYFPLLLQHPRKCDGVGINLLEENGLFPN